MIFYDLSDCFDFWLYLKNNQTNRINQFNHSPDKQLILKSY